MFECFFFLKGPDLTKSLVGVLLRFRQGKFAITGDIEKMFYMVKVPERDRNLLIFHWFPNGDLYAEPMSYRLNVHLFGELCGELNLFVIILLCALHYGKKIMY